MSHCTQEDVIGAWKHEADVCYYLRLNGWDTEQFAHDIPNRKNTYWPEKADAVGVYLPSGNQYTLMIKRCAWLDEIPDNCNDPIGFLQTVKLNDSLVNQRLKGEAGNRYLPIDVVWEDKFKDKELSDWEDTLVYDFYRKRAWVITDFKLRYIFIVGGLKVIKAEPMPYYLRGQGNNWNRVPLNDIKAVIKSTDTNYYRERPWRKL